MHSLMPDNQQITGLKTLFIKCTVDREDSIIAYKDNLLQCVQIEEQLNDMEN